MLPILQRLILIGLLISSPLFAQSTTSPVESWTYDSLGNGVTSHTSGSNRGLDVYCFNCSGGTGGGSGDGSILDGVDPSLKATVTAGNALKVDGSGVVQPASQSGTWSVGLTGTLPSFSSTPTFNLGTLNGAATSAKQDSLLTALGSPFQAGGSIANTSFAISGTLPSFASTPTFNLGTLNGAATSAKQDTLDTDLNSFKSANHTDQIAISANQTNGNQVAKVEGLTASSNDNPVMLGAQYSTALGVYSKAPLTTVAVGTDGFGNAENGLAVYDFAQGHSGAANFTLTSGSGNVFPVSSGAKTMYLDVSGTWTGSISVQAQLSVNTPTITMRQVGSNTTLSSITSNGLYVVEAETMASFNIVNSVATGSLDLYEYTDTSSTGVRAYQTGTWNVGVTTTVLATGASTSALQTTGNSSLSSIDAKTPALGQTTMSASTPVVLASNQTAVPVSIASMPSTPVSGTFWQSTQPVSIASMPSTPVTGTFWQTTQPVSGSVSVSNFPASQAVTGTFWQSTQPVSIASMPTTPVTGTVTSNQGTAAALASGWPVKVTDGTNTMPTADVAARAMFNEITDGTNTQSVKAASTGAVGADKASVVDQRPNQIASYATASAAFTPPATPTDVCTITGAAGKTIRIFKIVLNTTQTAAGINTWFLVKRSTANTVGTAVAETKVPLDSGDAAASATVQHYTANPTLGSTIGSIDVRNILAPVISSLMSNVDYTWNFDINKGLKQPLLKSTSEVLAVNFAGAALPAGLSVKCGFYWTEE